MNDYDFPRTTNQPNRNTTNNENEKFTEPEDKPDKF